MPSDSLILAGGFGPGYCSMLSSRTENCYLKKYTDTNMHFKDGISSLPRTETDPQGRKNCWWRICKWHHFKCSGVTLPPRWKRLWDDVSVVLAGPRPPLQQCACALPSEFPVSGSESFPWHPGPTLCYFPFCMLRTIWCLRAETMTLW